MIERPRLEAALTAAIESHRLTLVTAPAGYGKSTILADWARHSAPPCAWLSLDRFDSRPARLFRWVLAALQTAAGGYRGCGHEALLGLEQKLARDPAVSFDLVLGALEHLTDPMVLVLDDVELAGGHLAENIIGVLAASAPPALRIVLCGRWDPAIPVEKIRQGEGLAEFHAAELAFTREEVIRLSAAREDNGPLPDPGALWQATGGWPIGVRLGLASGLQTHGSPEALAEELAASGPLADYLVEEVLDQLPPTLADFLLHATACDRLDSRLAGQLHGAPGGGILLEECLRKGLFLEEHGRRGDEPVYRWHTLFAAQCRGLLQRRDPASAESLHRIAASHYQDIDVAECVAHALRGRDPLQAVTSLGSHWLEFVLRHEPGPLEQLCLELPAPWGADPEILMIRAACRSFCGDREAARNLTIRSLAAAPALSAERRRRLDITRSLFGLFILDNGSGLQTAAAEGRRLVDAAADGHGAAHAAGLFLLGQAEVRLQRDGDQAVSLLRAAISAGSANRVETVEVCAAAELALAFATTGDLSAAENQALRTLGLTRRQVWNAQEQLAPVWLARGIACYWQDNLNGARTCLARAAPAGSQPSSLLPLALMYRVLLDCAAAEPARLAEASATLQALEEQALDGLHAFHTIAKAKLFEAKGDLDGALTILQPLGTGGHSPVVDTLLAELLRRGGETAAAQRCIHSPAIQRSISYIDTSLSLTEALLDYAGGDKSAAHERLEHALRCAEPQSVLRPFTERGDELAELLLQHADWGSAHDSFVAARAAQYAQDHVRRTHSYWELTARECEVLAYMRSIMTAADIAAALFVSVNTVKTHQRSIYRKLGASSRREALRIAAERRLF
ncbi:LuxR C-terminal-related transcriptional regulator [Arthrobacter sp. I2-34]|uniref:LuxR C-terminal-related transcriptional regulator n=1 Tax=Arthrobacter hankyongi TaxID=2904801 RepID=A0ABS9LAR3_9MICC|nr:LuxR C-terminal-related transcriptional regulator [Arthrobacter hankyongi]MCG2623784.1 LuxR C-terminal-related transcriptional regulator [Arthrobacter hankyongi]